MFPVGIRDTGSKLYEMVIVTVHVVPWKGGDISGALSRRRYDLGSVQSATWF